MIDSIIRWIEGTYQAIYISLAGLFILTLFAFIARRYFVIFKGSVKMPVWLQRLYDSAMSMTSIPRWLIKVFLYLPAKFIETLWESLIVLAEKFRSRTWWVMICLFAIMLIVILKKDSDWQMLSGCALLITPMIPIITKFIESSDKDKDRRYGRSMEQEKIVGDGKKMKPTEDAK